MADIPTTSSKTLNSGPLNGPKELKKSSLTKPKVNEVQIVNSLAKNLNESYQNVKEKQKLYKEISAHEQLRDSKRRKVLSTVTENKENDQQNFADDDDDENTQTQENPQTEWQLVINNKNKLKRKKKLSASLTSVSDSVNQEKRTRIEGIQLNCRGRLQIKEDANGQIEVASHTNSANKTIEREKVITKPPVPPKAAANASPLQTSSSSPNSLQSPPPRLKRKLIENVQTIQKLNTLTEHLRLEINELKSNLAIEKGAVRVLRAQNDGESRKLKNEVKKLQQQIEQMKKGVLANARKQLESSITGMSESTISNSSATGLVNYEIQRLTSELHILKDANKTLEEKNLINYDADRRKTADIRELRDSYENRLTQIQKSAKTEISRLLEEIKTKERNIGQLKKDLQVLQNHQSSINTPTTSSLNKTSKKRSLPTATATATTPTTKNLNKTPTNPTTNDTTKQLLIPTNSTKKTNKKPKKTTNESSTSSSTTISTQITASLSSQHDQKSQECKQDATASDSQAKDVPDVSVRPTSTASASEDAKPDQHTNEITELKNIELIKNTKNLKPAAVTAASSSSSQSPSQPQPPPSSSLTSSSSLSISSINGVNLLIEPQTSPLPNFTDSLLVEKATASTTTTTTTASSAELHKSLCGSCRKEYYTMPPEMNDNYLTSSTVAEKPLGDTIMMDKDSTASHCTELPIYRSKDASSDSDSALSSAPPSISPQPPANGLEPNDIWQTIRSYTQDAERLQKEVDQLHHENERLQKELSLAKEQIIESEKAAIEASKQHQNVSEFLERIRYLEEQEHHLQNECSELREQNELLEFRILELEETNDKWSLQSHPPAVNTQISQSTASSSNAIQDFWAHSSGASSTSSSNGTSQSHSNSSRNKLDPMHLIFGSTNNSNHTNSNSNNCMIDSGITSPHSQVHTDDELHLMDLTNDELCRRLSHLIKKTTPLDDEDRQYLQQVVALVQHCDLLSQRTSGPASLNTSCSSGDEPTSLEMAKSRISDYSSASSSSATFLAQERHLTQSCESLSKSPKAAAGAIALADQCSSITIPLAGLVTSSPHPSSNRIIATVQPYNSSFGQSAGLIVPTNTPNDSPRRYSRSSSTNSNSQTSHTSHTLINSLSESGVFVEDSDCLDTSTTSSSHINEQSTATQTDFHFEEDLSYAKPFQQKLQRYHSSPLSRVSPHTALSTSFLSEQKHLQFYKDRLELLESKVLIYESSGDIQAKHLANRLQREVQLEKQVRELQQKVEFLESENSNLEEEKCEFEEAENDTRLRLQRLEIDLEILNQRNVELELSKEALSAKYKDCRSELSIVKEDLEACERQIELIDQDKKKAKQDLELLYKAIPFFYIHSVFLLLKANLLSLDTMGNVPSSTNLIGASMAMKSPVKDLPSSIMPSICSVCHQDARQLHLLREENISLRMQMNEMKNHHFAALETADNQWVDLEKSYKDREEAFLANEENLKQKIAKLQECLREDARVANEKISALEESEESLKVCLVRMSKEHRDLFEKYKVLCEDVDHLKEENETLKEESKPAMENLEAERRQTKELQDELKFLRHLQKEAEARYKAEEDSLRSVLTDYKKQILNADVTNSELNQEVATLEQELVAKTKSLNEALEKLRELYDELRSKDDIIEKMELSQKSDCNGASISLAHELKGRLRDNEKKVLTFSDEESKTDDDGPSTGKRRYSVNDVESEEGQSQKEDEEESPRDKKKVNIDDYSIDMEANQLKSNSSGRSGSRLVYTSILKKSEGVAQSSKPSIVSLGMESSSGINLRPGAPLPGLSTVQRPATNIETVRQKIAVKEDEIKDLQTARTALQGAVEHIEHLQVESQSQTEFQGVLWEVLKLVDGIIHLKEDVTADALPDSEESEEEEERMRRLVKEETRKLESRDRLSTVSLTQNRLASRSRPSLRSQNFFQPSSNRSTSPFRQSSSQATSKAEKREAAFDPPLEFNTARESGLPEESETKSEEVVVPPKQNSSELLEVQAKIDLVTSQLAKQHAHHGRQTDKENRKVTLVNMALLPDSVSHVQKSKDLPYSRPSLLVKGKSVHRLGPSPPQCQRPAGQGSDLCLGKRRRFRKRRPLQAVPSKVDGIFQHINKPDFKSECLELIEHLSLAPKESYRSITPWASPRSSRSPKKPTESRTPNEATMQTISVGPAVKSTVDQGTDPLNSHREISVQVGEADTAEIFLQNLPVRLKVFLHELVDSLPDHIIREKNFYYNFQKLWQDNEEFNKHLPSLCEFSENMNLGLAMTTENYEHYVHILSVIRVFDDLFHPHSIEFIKRLEDKINESLMNYHTKKVENDFYCTVYYPVPRPTNLNFIKQ